MTIGFEPEAELQAVEAAEWYKQERPGLGDVFITSVEETLQQILRVPFAQVIYGNVRARQTKGFPYRVFYIVDEARQHIDVIGVIHTARSPRRWPGT